MESVSHVHSWEGFELKDEEPNVVGQKDCIIAENIAGKLRPFEVNDVFNVTSEEFSVLWLGHTDE